MATIKAVTYLRVSGKAQVKGDGFPRQRAKCAEYAKANGIEIVDEYRDEGVSGTKDLEGRVALAELLDRLGNNGIRMVLIENSTRLARDLVVGEVILGELRDMGVQVIDASSGIELTVGDNDPTKKLIRQVLGAVAEYDKTLLVLKLRASRERMRKETGRCEGAKPFGFYPGEQEIVNRMKRLRRKPRMGKRMSYAKIAEDLNAAGLKTRSGKPWAASSVRVIVTR